MDWTVEQSEVKFNVKLPRSTQFDAAAVKASLGVGCPIGMNSKPRLRRWRHAPAPRGGIAFLQWLAAQPRDEDSIILTRPVQRL